MNLRSHAGNHYGHPTREVDFFSETNLKGKSKKRKQLLRNTSGQSDKLSYNLLHQIESGLRRVLGESDVIEAVIRAISPGLKAP